jgi:hypothetical protein
MSKWVHADVLDYGLNRIKTDCDAQWLLKAYAAGDSFATVQGNMVAAVAMADADFTIATGGSSSRTLTTASGKTDSSANADSGATPDLHIAFVDTVNSKVLWVTNETSDVEVETADVVNFPSLVFTSSQPS